MKKRKLILLVLPIIAIILEMLPYGAVLNFATPTSGPIRKTYPYFSLVTYGYANFAPLIAAVLTCVLFILCVVFTFKDGKKMQNAIKMISTLSLAVVILALISGNLTTVSLLIFIVLFLEACLVYIKPKT